MTRGIAAVILAALLELSCAKSVPPVPLITVDGLDADVRTAILKARDEAVAQPKSAQASGNLGMVLEAHTLYQPAVPAYQRAVRPGSEGLRVAILSGALPRKERPAG